MKYRGEMINLICILNGKESEIWPAEQNLRIKYPSVMVWEYFIKLHQITCLHLL